jgi:hypothetical protein
MAIPTPPSYTLGNLEAAAVSFVGAFAGAEVLGGVDLLHGIYVGLVAFAVALGYTAYQTS